VIVAVTLLLCVAAFIAGWIGCALISDLYVPIKLRSKP
jgi:hypothetical protein